MITTVECVLLAMLLISTLFVCTNCNYTKDHTKVGGCLHGTILLLHGWLRSRVAYTVHVKLKEAAFSHSLAL